MKLDPTGDREPRIDADPTRDRDQRSAAPGSNAYRRPVVWHPTGSTEGAFGVENRRSIQNPKGAPRAWAG
jgi:hypothetical protein